MNDNAKKRAEIVKRLVAAHYEPGRHDRCKLWVFRNVVSREMPIGERTFWRYLSENNEPDGDDNRQMKLDL